MAPSTMSWHGQAEQPMMLRGRSVLAGVPQHRKRFLLPPHTPSPFCAAGSTVSLRRSSPQVRGAPRHSWQARGDDVCTAPRLASPAFASSSSPVLATQIRHGLQTGSSFLGAAAGEALGFRLTLFNFKVRVQLLLLNLCSELAEFDAFGAPSSSRTCTCTPALSLDPAHAFRSSCILLAHNTPLPLRRRRALTSRRSTLRPTTTGHACLPPRNAPRSPERDCLCQRGRSLRPRPSQSLTPPECRDHPDSTSHFCL